MTTFLRNSNSHLDSIKFVKISFHCLLIFLKTFRIGTWHSRHKYEIWDLTSFWLFKHVRSEPLHDNNRKCLYIPFANKGIGSNNMSNILNRKEVMTEIPPYLNQSVPVVPYSYTNTIVRNCFNYKQVLQDVAYIENLLTCDCSISTFV